MRTTIFCPAMFAAGAMLSPAFARAQASAPAAVGERVRVATPVRYGEFRYVGRVVSLHGDSMSVLADGSDGTQAIPLAEITSLEVSGGTRTNGKRGMLYGGVIGAAGGAVIGAALSRKPGPACESELFCVQPEADRALDAVAGMVTGGVLGLAVGGLIGMSHRTERWIPRPLGSRGRVGVVPARGGRAAVNVSMRF